MKKIILLFSLFLLLTVALSACGNTKTSGNTGAEESAGTGADGKGDASLEIVTTIFPEYDWVNEILGTHKEEADVTLLLGSGVDMHSFQPTVDDIMKISECDLFIYVGGESDEWVEDALKEAVNKDMAVINLLDILGKQAKEEEVKEGMEAEEEEGEETEGTEYDEHVWLSLKNAKLFCTEIASALKQADEANAGDYEKNLAAYTGKLDSLDREYKSAVDRASIKTVLFGDRFPFRYLTEDYGLDYYAAFAGCSAETEASFETITFLTKKVDELSLPAIFVMEGDEHKIAETIRNNTKTQEQEILVLDSMQSVSLEDAENGVDYLSVMEENLGKLKNGLGVKDTF